MLRSKRAFLEDNPVVSLPRVTALSFVLLVALAAPSSGRRAGSADSIALRSSKTIAGQAGWIPVDAIHWPSGTETIRCENLEGVLLLTASVRGLDGRDTTGSFVLDTGAGYLALDAGLARRLGVIDSVGRGDEVGLAVRPLPRFTLGTLSMDQVDPVLTVDAGLVRRVTDRPVLGLLGQRPLSERAVWIDFQAGLVALVPSTQAATDDERPETADQVTESRGLLAGALSPTAIAVPFRLAGDGKVLIEARVSNPLPPRFSPWLTLIVDTGASKCVLFEETLDPVTMHAEDWRGLEGLAAPTLLGVAEARIARIPAIELRGAALPGARATEVDVAVIRGALAGVLARATRETIHGLLGYSFLRRFRVVFDYPHRVLWLDPSPGWRDDRPYEYTHVGIQLERFGGRVRIAAVAEDSPAARAGIVAGDELIMLNGNRADATDVITLARRLEGPAGTRITLLIRHNDAERVYRLRRRRLL